MALAATIVWEARTVGTHANNGGGFNSAAAGTDRSLQAAAHVVVDGATITAVVHTTTTQLNITGYTVSAADVGNIYRGAGGTATTGYYEVTAVDVGNNRWTMDRSVGTAAQTSTGRMGGALDHPKRIMDENTITPLPILAGHKAWLKNDGNYRQSIYMTMTAVGTVTAPIFISGYTSTRGDTGRATLKPATPGQEPGRLMYISGDYWHIRNIIFDGEKVDATDQGSVTGVHMVEYAGIHNAYFLNCGFINCYSFGVNLDSSPGSDWSCVFSQCWAENNGANIYNDAGFLSNSSSTIFHECVSQNNSGDGWVCAFGPHTFVRCVIRNNNRDGVRVTNATDGKVILIDCDIVSNNVSGVKINNGSDDWDPYIANCIFTDNAQYGVDNTGGLQGADWGAFHLRRNAFFNNTLGQTLGLPAGIDTIALTADPFVNEAGNNLNLNSAAGGGAALRDIANALPGTIAATSYLDVGAVESQCAFTEPDRDFKFGSYSFPSTFYPVEDPNSRITGQIKLPRSDGGRLTVGTLDRKTFGIAGGFIFGIIGGAALRIRLDALRTAVHGGPQNLYFWADRYWRNVQLTDYADTYERGNSFDRDVDVRLTFETGDPFQYSTTEQNVTTAISGSGQTSVVTPTGGAYSRPIIELTVGGAGAITLAATITNSTTGEAFTLAGAVTGGDIIIVDALEATVTIPGVDKMSLFDGVWPKLNVGANTLTVAYTSGTITQIKTRWRDRWW